MRETIAYLVFHEPVQKYSGCGAHLRRHTSDTIHASLAPTIVHAPQNMSKKSPQLYLRTVTILSISILNADFETTTPSGQRLIRNQ